MKQDFTEQEVREKIISPILTRKGWNDNDLKMEYLYKDAINEENKRFLKTIEQKTRKIDYAFFYSRDIPITILEAKRYSVKLNEKHIAQALEYGEDLNVPFVFLTNGKDVIKYYVNNKKKYEKFDIEDFPTKQEIWKEYIEMKNISPEGEKILSIPSFEKNKENPIRLRYYQRNAINAAINSIAENKKRFMIVMATGTGKTITTLQLIYKLREYYKTKKRNPRILFLVDRTELAEQTYNSIQNNFSEEFTKMSTIVDPQFRKKSSYKTSYEVYISLYQGLSTTDKNTQNLFYKAFKPDFFDFIIIDECHRGATSEESSWREILEYYSSATHIGLTATPKDDEKKSNFEYFGKPIYTYSLKQGIQDGFLAPYQIIKVNLDIDETGYISENNEIDKNGLELNSQYFSSKSFNRNIIIEQRDKAVAERISLFLKNTNPMDKTIVFCKDDEHAERMKNILSEVNKEMQEQFNNEYVVKITSENQEKSRLIQSFSGTGDKNKIPVIATTVELLTTGIDTKDCKLIVIDTNIQSQIKFKQIIGRGTRLNPKNNKHYFTIMDFGDSVDKFHDPNFDSDAFELRTIGSQLNEFKDKTIKTKLSTEILLDKKEKSDQKQTQKYVVEGKEVSVKGEKISFFDIDGTPITKDFFIYTKEQGDKLFNSYQDFIEKWKSENFRTQFITDLESKGILIAELRKKWLHDHPTFVQIDDLDIIANCLFNKVVISREKRSEIAKNKLKAKLQLEENSKKFKIIIELINKYAEFGLAEIEDRKTLESEPFTSIGTISNIISEFGNLEGYQKVLLDIKEALYLE